MRRLLVLCVLLAAGCAVSPPSSVDPSIQDAFSRAEKQKAPAAPPLELLPPLRMEMPKVGGEPIDQRFDLSVATAPASQGFNSLVAGTRYSLPVTTNQEAMFWSDLCEALVAITFPPSRQASAEAAAAASAAASVAGLQPPEERQRAICNRRHAESDRSIVVSPQSGIVVVRATPSELRAVEDYLRATRLAVERQVRLEAKIIEVTLSDQFQSGINWALFNQHVAIGQVNRPLSAPRTLFESSTPPIQVPSVTPTDSAPTVARTVAAAQLLTGPAGAVVGLAAATNSFAALVTFLETQGNVQVLSSPRVVTINNQKAVLKVGQDELFVSNVTVTPPTIGTVSTPATVSPEFQPYFSGIVLDVTPQIDERSMITLHIHPTINDIVQVQRVLDLGSAGSFNVPTARNTIRETDTIVRVADSNIVAIGGLMSTELNDVPGGIPGAPDSGPASVLLRSTNRVREKKELVILLKPSILESDRDWSDGMREARERIEALGREMGAREGR